MSEFFKALEQAERDRARENAADAGVAARENGTVPAAPPVSEPVVAEQAGGESSMRERRAPKEEAPRPAVAERAAPHEAAAKPAAAQRMATEGVAETPVAPNGIPAYPVAAPSPGSVFRPSLRTPPRSRLIGRRGGRRPVLVALTDPSSVEADAYRTLRANLELMSNGVPSRHIAITSAAGGDGKSTTASNLAIVAAQAGRRVCLVDADFRRPMLHEVFGLSNIDGLALALEHGKPLQAVARAVDIDNLSVVVAGRGAERTFQDLLTAQRLQRVLRDSEAAFDFVVFDSPPVVVADTLSVAAVCDGVILVVRAGSIPFSVLQRAIGQVKQVKGRVLGVLLNQANFRGSDADSYRYYRAYHSTRSPE